MRDRIPSDPQNWMEKLSIVEKLGQINVNVAEMKAEIKSLKESKDVMHRALVERINGQDSVLFGNGHDGLKTQVDRVYEDYKTNQQARQADKESNRNHRLFIYGSLIILFAQAVVRWIVPGIHF